MLGLYVAAWKQSADDIATLAPTVPLASWDLPTDCPGWRVRDVVAHLAHLEAVLAGLEPDDLPAPDGAGEVVSSYTEAGVAARADVPVTDLLHTLATAVATRADQLAVLPDDPQAPADRTPGGVAWSWDTLLRNRTVDMWVHEQDLRRAVGRPGGMDTPAAQVTATTFAMALPYVVGKRVKPPVGTSVRLVVTGEVPSELTVRIGDDGRAAPVPDVDADATVTLSTEAFTILAAGRRRPDAVASQVEGDEQLAHAVLSSLTVTP